MFTVNIGCESDIPGHVRDFYCDDQNNNEGCLFDGGDCCRPNVNTQFCTLCFCHEDLNCDAPMELIGNGVCNDEANNEHCNYDSGDCKSFFNNEMKINIIFSDDSQVEAFAKEGGQKIGKNANVRKYNLCYLLYN